MSAYIVNPEHLGILAAYAAFHRVVISAWSVVEYVEADILLEGLLRMACFGLTVGLATTHAGLSLWLTDRRGASDVGAAVYGGSVVSACGIVAVNLIASLLGSAG